MNDRPCDLGHDRRQILIFLGAVSTGILGMPAAARTRPECIVTPAQTEGPFFVDDRLNRSDIRADPGDGTQRPGVPLTLTLRVSMITAAGCKPLQGALVDVWHCDATGVYSGTRDAPFSRFLRGQQLTNSSGDTEFLTIYPGWYPGRAVHAHFKVRAKTATERLAEFTSQIYFDDAATARIMTLPPYAGRDERRRPRNEADGLYRSGGQQLMAALSGGRGNEHAASIHASFHIALRL